MVDDKVVVRVAVERDGEERLPVVRRRLRHPQTRGKLLHVHLALLDQLRLLLLHECLQRPLLRPVEIARAHHLAIRQIVERRHILRLEPPRRVRRVEPREKLEASEIPRRTRCRTVRARPQRRCKPQIPPLDRRVGRHIKEHEAQRGIPEHKPRVAAAWWREVAGHELVRLARPPQVPQAPPDGEGGRRGGVGVDCAPVEARQGVHTAVLPPREVAQQREAPRGGRDPVGPPVRRVEAPLHPHRRRERDSKYRRCRGEVELLVHKVRARPARVRESASGDVKLPSADQENSDDPRPAVQHDERQQREERLDDQEGHRRHCLGRLLDDLDGDDYALEEEEHEHRVHDEEHCKDPRERLVRVCRCRRVCPRHACLLG
mmetsp:Transcript_49473/g.120769  ORF Transcript_49473/g.120769 Transcript_49473/m.120769 type:complete len:375 (+) Transcript_49473:1199-2323(+)